MNLVKKIKMMGTKRAMHSAIVKLSSPLNRAFFNIFKLVKVDQSLIVFESEGDFCDNAYALYDYIRKSSQYSKYHFVWLVDDINRFSQMDYGRTIFVEKKATFIKFRRDYLLATCAWYIYDHCNILGEYKFRKEQTIINLFHGCTFKLTKGASVKASNTESMMPVTSDFWVDIMADFVLCDKQKVVALGYPRNDYLFTQSNEVTEFIEKQGWNKFTSISIWMPTFRLSKTVNLSEEYYKGNTGLPILENVSDLLSLNELLSRLNALMIFKVHHLQAEYPAFQHKYSNIWIMKDEELSSLGVQLYQVVRCANFLITDYSSISNDYLLLDRPIIFTLDDYEEYRQSRGFSVDDPAQYFPGYHVISKVQLFDAINEVIDGVDKYVDERHEILQLMHKYTDGNSSKRIVEYLGL